MEHQTAALNLADINEHQQFTVRGLRANRSTEIEDAFLAVDLSDLKVEFGVMHGEIIQVIEDLQVGDEVRLTHRQQGFVANSQYCRHHQDSLYENHARLVSDLSGCAQKQQVQLMGENGSLVKAYGITPVSKAGIQPYLLLPRQFSSVSRYCLIDLSEV